MIWVPRVADSYTELGPPEVIMKILVSLFIQHHEITFDEKKSQNRPVWCEPSMRFWKYLYRKIASPVTDIPIGSQANAHENIEIFTTDIYNSEARTR